MIIEICSQKKAIEMASATRNTMSIISITSKEQKDILFPSNFCIKSVLRLKFNDLAAEYDEEGIPYGRDLPITEDFTGLKEFIDQLSCDILLIHCWEGTSRSAAVAEAVYGYRNCRDTIRTYQSFAPNPLVYDLACDELGIRYTNFRLQVKPEK